MQPLCAAYRRSALKIISAFHTMSTDSAVMIEGIMPLKLVVDKEKKKHYTRRGMDLSNPVQIVDNIYGYRGCK